MSELFVGLQLANTGGILINTTVDFIKTERKASHDKKKRKEEQRIEEETRERNNKPVKAYYDCWKPVNKILNSLKVASAKYEELQYDETSFQEDALVSFKDTVSQALNDFQNGVIQVRQNLNEATTLNSECRHLLQKSLNDMEKTIENSELEIIFGILVLAYNKKDFETMKAKLEEAKSFKVKIEKAKVHSFPTAASSGSEKDSSDD